MNQKGQNILEYVILLVGIITVLMLFLAPNGIFRRHLTDTLDTSVNMVDDMVDNLNFAE